MITRVTVRNFKRFEEETFDLAESVVLAGPNNSGKSTLLQAIATWKFGLDRWREKQSGSKAAQRSGAPISRSDFFTVPLREMNLLWEGRRVAAGAKGMSGPQRPIEIIVEGDGWKCGLEFHYRNSDQMYVRPLGAKDLSPEDIRNFPPEEARTLDIVFMPPLSGIEREEPRRDQGLQNLLIGEGRPGDILRNLLWEVSEHSDKSRWKEFVSHFKELFAIELMKPEYSPSAQAHIVCEYREQGRHGRKQTLDLSNAGSGTLQVLLVFAFLYARPASMILLDEPDAHQHIILQGQAYDLVRGVARGMGGQVVIATHSEVVLDATDPEQVLGFFGGSPRPLADGKERAQVREARRRIPTTDLLLAKQTNSVLYVEGESDHRILAAWARILDHPAKEFFDEPFIHVLRGNDLKSAWDHFFAMQEACPKLRALCLPDGDREGDGGGPEAGSPDGDSGLKVIRWKRYEIENYLLHPDAIKRFVISSLYRPRASGGLFDLANRRSVDSSRYERQIEEAFHKQVPQGTDPFSDHVSLTRIKGSSEFLVPLLESTPRPTAKRDLYQLAETMKPEEIHPEARSKLDEIAQALLP